MNSSAEAETMPAELQQIAAEAAQLEAETAPPAAADPDAPAGSETAPPIDFQSEARAMIDLSVNMLVPFYPCLERVWTPEKIERLATVTAPLMEQYGFTLGDFFGKYGNWIAFASVSVPLGMETYRAVKAENEQIEKAKAAKAPETTMQPIIDQPAPDSLHLKV